MSDDNNSKMNKSNETLTVQSNSKQYARISTEIEDAAGNLIAATNNTLKFTGTSNDDVEAVAQKNLAVSTGDGDDRVWISGANNATVTTGKNDALGEWSAYNLGTPAIAFDRDRVEAVDVTNLKLSTGRDEDQVRVGFSSGEIYTDDGDDKIVLTDDIRNSSFPSTLKIDGGAGQDTFAIENGAVYYDGKLAYEGIEIKSFKNSIGGVTTLELSNGANIELLGIENIRISGEWHGASGSYSAKPVPEKGAKR